MAYYYPRTSAPCSMHPLDAHPLEWPLGLYTIFADNATAQFANGLGGTWVSHVLPELCTSFFHVCWCFDCRVWCMLYGVWVLLCVLPTLLSVHNWLVTVPLYAGVCVQRAPSVDGCRGSHAPLSVYTGTLTYTCRRNASSGCYRCPWDNIAFPFMRCGHTLMMRESSNIVRMHEV